MPSTHPTRILIVIGAAVLVAVVIAVLWSLRTTSPEEGRAAETGTPRDVAIVVAASEGVQRSAGPKWVKAVPGDELRATDSLRTGANAKAEIGLGRGGTLEVASQSEVTIREFTAAVQRLAIGRGRMGVDLRPDDLRILRAEDRSGTIFASASAGRWHVVATPRGLGVAAENGDVRVESAGVAVDVPPGSESAAWRGATPLPPAPIPKAPSVRLAPWGEKRRPRICAVLQTDVASEVLVDGAPLEVRADGGVTVLMPPRAKRHEANVVVRHATGHVERKTIRCGEGGVAMEDASAGPTAR